MTYSFSQLNAITRLFAFIGHAVTVKEIKDDLVVIPFTLDEIEAEIEANQED